MRKGGGKGKGASFERRICKALSLWVSGGKNEDLFWRSAMSGGRATLQYRKGNINRQAGDICAVAPEGHAFTNVWFVECKHIKAMNLSAFLLSNQGPLAKFWRVACREARKHKRRPMLIVQSRGPIVVFAHDLGYYANAVVTGHERNCCVYFFDEMISTPFLD